MLGISRGAVVAVFITFTVPLYCGSFWYVWPCRHTGVGRELREVSLMRSEQHDAGCKNSTSSLFLDITEAGQATLMKAGKAGMQAVGVLKEASRHAQRGKYDSMSESGGFVNPFEADWDKALKQGSDYHDALSKCVKKDWTVVNAGYIGAYHLAERIKTAKAVVADPDPAKSLNLKICPRSEAETAEFNGIAADEQNALDGKVKEVKMHVTNSSLLEGDNHDRDTFAAVHFASVDNAIRKEFGKKEHPMTASFIATNWIPIVNKMFTDMRDTYQQEGHMTLPAVHTYLTMNQVEELRAGVQSGSLAQR